MRVVPRFTHAQTVEALKRSMALYNSVGTTGTYEEHGVAPEIARAYKEVWDSGAATVRSHLALNPVWESTAEAEQDMEQWAYTASGSGFGSEMLKLTGVYLQYGGSQYISESRLAELPFTGWAGSGQTRNDAGRIQEFAHLAARHNLRVNTLVRDTLEEVLTIFEEVHGVTPIDDRRWVINQVLQASPQQLQRINKLGLVVETIPLTELWLRGSKFVESARSSRQRSVPPKIWRHGSPIRVRHRQQTLLPLCDLVGSGGPDRAWHRNRPRSRTTPESRGRSARIHNGRRVFLLLRRPSGYHRSWETSRYGGVVR